MIFTERAENNKIIFNEGFKFKTKEEAERALEKVSNNEKGLEDYLNWGFKFGITPVIIINGIVVIPIGMLLIQAFSTWLAFPGSAGDKLNKCNKIINKCNRTIDHLSKKNDADSKKMIDEYKKVKNRAMSEKEKYEKRTKELGTYNSNWKESMIFNNINFI